MNCYTWMELMKQGLEVLWWKHNMIPTKGSIQQTPPLPATHLWHIPPTTTYFLLQSDRNQSGLLGQQTCWWGTESNCESVYKQLLCSPLLRLLSAEEREILENPWSPEECQSPAMHGEYPLLAHSFIQTWVGTPQGPPLSGAPSIFISTDGAPKC